MNLNTIKKRVNNCVRINWSVELFDELNLSELELETIILTLIDFEKKKSVKTIVLANYKGTPMYIVINRESVPSLLNYLLEKFTNEEKYELCHQINLIRYDNNK